MEDDFTPIEGFLDRGTAQIKWTISITTFLITAIFTVMAFKGITFIKPITYAVTGLLVLSISFLLISIIFGWIATNNIFILHGKILDARTKTEISEDIKKEATDIADNIKNYVKHHILFFLIGIISVMLFFLSYIVLINMNVLKSQP